MNKMKKFLLAGCVAFAGLCLAQSNTYMVIDLSGGSTATSYPVSYLDVVPGGGWTANHKTNSLVLRKIEQGGTNYFIGIYEVTRGQADRVVPEPDPSGDYPKNTYMRDDMVNFITGLKTRTGLFVDFPSEEQWEFACRAGTTNLYHYNGGTDDPAPLTNYAWFLNNSGTNTHAVGMKLPNPWGIYDLYGNVKEVCLGSSVPLRGGHYRDQAVACTSVSRTTGFSAADPQVGFRIVAKVPQLKVIGGTGGGFYTNGTSVTVSATAVPYQDFVKWLVQPADIPLGPGFVATNATTHVITTSYDTTLTASNTPTLYKLTVNGGTGSGSFTNGHMATIMASNPPPAQVFDRWTGDTNHVANIFATNTTVTILGASVTVTATYKDAPYTLTVYAGQSTNVSQHASGETVAIAADAPPPGQMFDVWQVVPSGVVLGPDFKVNSATTTLIMPNTHIQLTATFKTIPKYMLTVVGGTGSGSYISGELVSVKANTVAESVFSFWGVSPAGISLGAGFVSNSATTTVSMPTNAVTLTANYQVLQYPLTVVNGLGSGSYAKGAVVTIAVTATNLPSAGHMFDRWTGATQLVADVFAPTTTVTMASGAATLTATFRPIPVLQNTYLVVDLSGNTVTNLDAPPAGGWGETNKTAQMVFRKVPAGTFTMGSSTESDATPHTVTLTKDFYLGVFEVTQAQWLRVDSSTPSAFSGLTLPVEQVSYADIRGANRGAAWPSNSFVDADSFVGKFRMKNAALAAADLPTEAQWEYACRAGTTGAYAGTLGAMAWYDANNTPNGTKVVGAKTPNAWGLYDMHGNVYEICLDWYGSYAGGAQTDPVGPSGVTPGTPGFRVMRGGAYNGDAVHAQSAYRSGLSVSNYMTGAGTSISNRYPWAGLRLAVPQTTASYQLTVVNGTVNTGGFYSAGTQIGISAAPTNKVFDKWVVVPVDAALGAAFVATRPDTLLTMPSKAVKVEAVYKSGGSGSSYLFSQNNPDGVVTLVKAAGETFQITAPAAAAGYQFSKWTVAPATANLGAGFNSTSQVATVVMPALNVMVTPGYVPVVTENPIVGVKYAFNASDGQEPATYSASGLPSGLRIDSKTGVIYGYPTKPGTFNVKITARRSDGTTTYTMTLTVDPLPATAQGTFTGYVFDEGGPAGVKRVLGTLSLTVSKTGVPSAKVVMQTASYSFSDKGWDDVTTGGDYHLLMTRTYGEQLEITVDVGDSTLTGTLKGGPLGSSAFDVAGQKNRFLDLADTAAQVELAKYKGYYTVVLPAEVCLSCDPVVSNVPYGSGYLTVTVGDKGTVKIAGKVADGTSVSASTTLLKDALGAYVTVFVPLYSKRGVLSGLLLFTGGATPAEKRLEDHADFLMEWLYPGTSATMTANRFDEQLSAYGAFYNKTASLQAQYGSAHFSAENQAWAPVPLVVSSTDVVSLPKDPVINPAQATLSVTKSSGLFKGSFKVVNAATGRTETLSHVGVLTRAGDVSVGEGAYVWPWKLGSYTIKSSFRVIIE